MTPTSWGDPSPQTPTADLEHLRKAWLALQPMWREHAIQLAGCLRSMLEAPGPAVEARARNASRIFHEAFVAYTEAGDRYSDAVLSASDSI